MFVLDCSVALAWCFEDESSDYADKVLDCLEEQTALVPRLWHLEVLNVLVVGERRQRIQPPELQDFLKLLTALDIQTDKYSPIIEDNALFHLAQTHQLSAYDATYLALALREKLPLATQDKRLRQVAESLGCYFQIQP
ncbi:Predicted nucleic acid-binding protein, contains PIN domain [Thiothrix eikelboomii]|uniref:Predicted nucleic acid-binding protein, contains PIN domain n=1 Tax=Thiothrix eikelboomii TaxID=92487 RepID=A0A1T4Y4Z7_9GAMM|nr:type II toxin-antitoxin system VapC family toxin [Thiothrix eikelboomii]SKA96877.1 Predicted nucleic acid-binding protein, contains PIN domain [Thiothrix eikelboomii]